MIYYQWTDGSLHVTEECSRVLGCARYHGRGSLTVYWAWDRSIGAWVHYAA
jgi:hypothetical protein